MNIQQLRYLVATADTGTMTGAAAALHMSQPALSRALHALEDEVGSALFVRAGRRVELTDHGRQVVEVARRVVRDVDSLAALRDATTRVCATATQARELCAGALRRLGEAAPEVTIETADSAAQVAQRVEDGVAELGVCDLPVDAPLSCTLLGVQELALAYPSGWDLPDPLPFRALDGLDLIGPSPTDRRRAELSSAFAQLGIEPRVTVTTDQRDLVMPLLRNGLGATFVWPMTARDARREGLGVSRLDPPVRRQVGVLRRQGRLTLGARRVLAALEAEATEALTTGG